MSTTQILIYAVIAIVVIAIIYYIYKRYKKHKIVYYDSATVVDEKHNAMKHKSVRGTQIPPPLQGNEYAISTWIYLNDYNYRYGQTKHVLYRGVEKDDNIEANPHIFLHPTESTLMCRFKLQSDTVPDPNAHLKKITVADSMNGNNVTVNNAINNAENNTGNNLPEDNISNISGNNAVDPGTNGVNAVDGPEGEVNSNVETFYSGLGSNIIDSNINPDQMTHNFAIVSEGFDRVGNHPTQIKELFEESNQIVNTPVNNVVPANDADSSDVVSNAASVNGGNNLPLPDGNNVALEPGPVSQDFIEGNPFIAAFMDKYSKATTPEERQGIANEYANNFVDKTEEERKEIAHQFMLTLARMFASTMGLTVIDDKEYSKAELEEAKRQEQLFDTCYIRNIPMQKWVNISLSVYQNTVDIFMDGKLMSSCNLKGFPQPNKHDVIVAPKEGFDGFISNTKFFNMAFTPEKALELYQEGPATSKGFLSSLKPW